MSLREFMNKNSALVTIVAVVLLLVSLGFIIMNVTGGGGSRPRVVDVYYFDTGSGELFNAQSNEIPPIKAPSEKAGVRAYVFSCGECGDKSQEFIGWMEMYTPDAKRIMESPPTDAESMDSFEIMEQGHLVSADGKQWVPANGEAGFRVMEAMQGKCGQSAPTPCYPGR